MFYSSLSLSNSSPSRSDIEFQTLEKIGLPFRIFKGTEVVSCGRRKSTSNIAGTGTLIHFVPSIHVAGF